MRGQDLPLRPSQQAREALGVPHYRSDGHLSRRRGDRPDAGYRSVQGRVRRGERGALRAGVVDEEHALGPIFVHGALTRLPEEHRAVLARARAIYLGDEEERWDDIKPRVRPHADHVVGEIERLAADAAAIPEPSSY